MTEPEATHDAITLSNVDDLLTKAHELAVSARKRAADEGLHEHYKDQVYLNAVQVALMELRPCTCEKCVPVEAKRHWGWLVLVGTCAAFAVSSIYRLRNDMSSIDRFMDAALFVIFVNLASRSLVCFWKRFPRRKL